MSIEIIVEHHILLESMIQNWKSDDLSLSYYHDHLEQIRFSAYSPHIDVLLTKTSLDKRIISLNILLNGAIFITNTKEEQKIAFSSYETHDIKIEQDSYYGGLWSDDIEEYPFSNDEKHHIENLNLKFPIRLNALLFSMAKVDFTLRTLLFQAGLLSSNSITDKILTWGTLYKMVDTIREGCKETGIDIYTLINKKSLNKFTFTCNNPFVLGIYARHGKGDKNQNIPEPLTNIEQAIELILCLSNHFSRQYLLKKYKIKTTNNSSLSACEIKKSSKEIRDLAWDKLRRFK